MGRFASVRGNDEDDSFRQVVEQIELVVFTIVSPDHPNSSTRRSLSQHFERAVAAVAQRVDPCESRFDFDRRKRVGGDLLKVPVDPFESPHAGFSLVIRRVPRNRRHAMCAFFFRPLR